MGMLNDISTQLFHRPDCPTANFSGKTVIITGSNVGLGKETVKHLVRLDAEKVIIAVRSFAKGEAAKAEIESESGRTGVVDVWELDLSHYASVKTFAKRAASLDCLDAAVLNAGIATEIYEILEDNESTITVSTLLQLFAVREIAEQTANKKPSVIANTLEPGLCHTDLTRHVEGTTAAVMVLMRYLLAWTAEEGSRNLVLATTAGPESHGVMMSGGRIKSNILSPFVPSDEGRKTQEKIWGEIAAKIEKIQPGILAELGLQA
ncbi:MAG: hypothetical protein Q9161_001532 [Pseudevernia consocians]